MNNDRQQTLASQPLVMLAAFVVVIAGMRASTPILVPFLLSVFIAVISATPLFWLRSKGIPMVISLLIVIFAIVLVVFGIATLIGTSLDDFASDIPGYQARLDEQTSALVAWLAGLGVTLPRETLLQQFDPSRVMKVVAQSLASFSGVLANTFLIVLTVIFMLLEASSFPRKLNAIVHDPGRSLAKAQKILDDLKRYIAIKSAISVLTGVLIAGWLSMLGVDYAVLWGVVAFFLNYVPNIGSIIAAVPAVLLALVQMGFGQALLVAAGYAAVNILVGTVLEPRIMGRSLGLSTLVVFLSLIFWGWVLGPVGMVLSVPLTMLVRIALQGNESTGWIAVLLGPEIAELESVDVAKGDDTSSNAHSSESTSTLS